MLPQPRTFDELNTKTTEMVEKEGEEREE